MSFTVISKWQQQQPRPAPKTDAERHEAFVNYALTAVQTHMPWLVPLLDESSATVYVGPSIFAFQVRSKGAQWYEVPELSKYISMLPWAETDETPQ